MTECRLDEEVLGAARAWKKAWSAPVLISQLIANVIVLLVALTGMDIWFSFAARGILLSVTGLIIGLICLAIATAVLAINAGGINRQLFFPPSTYEPIWKTLPAFVRRNAAALFVGTGSCFAFFGGVIIVLLILMAVAGAAQGFGRILFALLYIPIILLAAAGILSLVFAIFVIPAEVALHESTTKSPAATLMQGGVKRLLQIMCSIGVALVAAFLSVLPFLMLLGAAEMLLALTAVSGGGLAAYLSIAGASSLLGLMRMLLFAAVAAVPLTCFTAIVGQRYRDMVSGDDDDVVRDANF